MKYQIRKCEEITIWQATEVAELDPEDFRNLEENSYSGNSEEDFVNYIAGFIDSCRWDGVPSYLSMEAADELDKMIENVNWKEYANSTHKGENSWIEIGEVNDEYRKTGNFEIRFNTAP
jgi:hypothetical protein